MSRPTACSAPGATRCQANRLVNWTVLSGADDMAVVGAYRLLKTLLDDDAQDRIGQGNWTVAAEIGAAHYILSLLDVDLAADRALAWYQAALDGRTGEAREHAQMLDFIQARLPSSRE